MMTGPSELEAIAGVNTTNDALRRALIGQDVLRLTHTLLPQHGPTPANPLAKCSQKYLAENPSEL